MKIYALLIFIYISCIFALISIVSVFGIRRVPDISQFQADRLVPIYSNSPATQTFIANHNGLNTILINLKNRSILNNKTFEFVLLESDKEIRKITLNGSNIGDGDNVRFQFQPIVDSKGRTFVIKLTSPDTYQGDIPIEVSFSNSDSYLYGSSLDINQNGDFAFQTYYKPLSASSTLEGLVQRSKSLFFNLKTIISILVVSGIFLVTAKKVGFRYN